MYLLTKTKVNKNVLLNRGLKTGSKQKSKSKGVNKNKSLIRNKNLYLTYSSTSNLKSRDYLLDKLDKVDKIKIKNAVVALEYHLDGEPHFHVVLTLETQPNCSMNTFDIEDPIKKGVFYHPHIQPASFPHDILYSIKTDKEYLLRGFDIEACKLKMKEIESKDIMQETVHVFNASGYDAALDYFLEKATVAQQIKFGSRITNLIKSLNQIKYRLPFPKAEYILNDFYTVKGVEHFINNFDKKSGYGALFIGGVSGVGKTAYIEALLTELNYKWLTVTSFEQLKLYDINSVDFLIFDDVNFKRLEESEDFLKLFEHKKTVPIPCRIKDVIVPAGVGRIYLSNISFNELLTDRGLENNAALLRRVYECVLIHYLSPKIPRSKILKAIDLYPQHQKPKDVNITVNLNLVNSTFNGDINLDLRSFIIPEYSSMDTPIKDIDYFALQVKNAKES